MGERRKPLGGIKRNFHRVYLLLQKMTTFDKPQPKSSRMQLI